MRSEYCGLVSRDHLGKVVTVQGWVHRRRDHGGVIFIDLRDREGLLQVVVDPDTPDTFKTAEALRNEFVVSVTGKVRPRPDGTVNSHLVSGEIEVLAQSIENKKLKIENTHKENVINEFISKLLSLSFFSTVTISFNKS